MGQLEKYRAYLSRASYAEEQAAKTVHPSMRTVWLRAAKEYRQAAQEMAIEEVYLRPLSELKTPRLKDDLHRQAK